MLERGIVIDGHRSAEICHGQIVGCLLRSSAMNDASAPPPPPPRSVALLIGHLGGAPRPEEFNIAILPDACADVDVDGAGPPSRYPEGAFAKVGTHLGLHAPCLPMLAREFREEYASLRARGRRRRRCHGSAEEEEEGGGPPESASASASARRMRDATSCLLLVCPDHSTAWADRRRAMLAGTNGAGDDERALRDELDFCNLLFTQHSKA